MISLDAVTSLLCRWDFIIQCKRKLCLWTINYIKMNLFVQHIESSSMDYLWVFWGCTASPQIIILHVLCTRTRAIKRNFYYRAVPTIITIWHRSNHLQVIPASFHTISYLAKHEEFHQAPPEVASTYHKHISLLLLKRSCHYFGLIIPFFN